MLQSEITYSNKNDMCDINNTCNICNICGICSNCGIYNTSGICSNWGMCNICCINKYVVSIIHVFVYIFNICGICNICRGIYNICDICNICCTYNSWDICQICDSVLPVTFAISLTFVIPVYVFAIYVIFVIL